MMAHDEDGCSNCSCQTDLICVKTSRTPLISPKFVAGTVRNYKLSCKLKINGTDFLTSIENDPQWRLKNNIAIYKNYTHTKSLTICVFLKSEKTSLRLQSRTSIKNEKTRYLAHVNISGIHCKCSASICRCCSALLLY